MADGDVRKTFLVCCLASGIVLGVALPSAATSIALTDVSLGTHRFGHLTTPDAIVARVAADGVGWDNPPEGSANRAVVVRCHRRRLRLLARPEQQPTAGMGPGRARGAGPNGAIAEGCDPRGRRPGGRVRRHDLPHVPPAGSTGRAEDVEGVCPEPQRQAPVDRADGHGVLQLSPPCCPGRLYHREGPYNTRKPPSGWWTPVTSPDGRPLPPRATAGRRHPIPADARRASVRTDRNGRRPTHEWRLTLMDRGRPAGMWRAQ